MKIKIILNKMFKFIGYVSLRMLSVLIPYYFLNAILMEVAYQGNVLIATLCSLLLLFVLMYWSSKCVTITVDDIFKENKEKLPDNVRKIKESVNHQNIGGKYITIERILTMKDISDQSLIGNIACMNYINRRQYFDINSNLKAYYGHVGDFGYVVSEDELEELSND